jgi:hydroxyacylglutathione hydrolase
LVVNLNKSLDNPLQIHRLILGPLQTNCYIVYDKQSTNGVVIDPADQGDTIVQVIQEHNWKIDHILLTHGHFDHIGGIGPLKEKLGATVYIHEKDTEILKDSKLNLSIFLSDSHCMVKADHFLKEGQSFQLGAGQLDVLHTPGHTPGGVSFVGAHFVIVGDTLFQSSIGRTDFPYASGKQLIQSIREKLFVLDDHLVVYPGHGPETTIGREKKENPFFAQDQSYI